MTRRYQWWSRRGDGAVTLRLRPDEAAFLAQLFRELRRSLVSSDDDAIAQRLFPRAYLDPTEEVAEREFQVLGHSSLLRTRLDSLGSLTALIEPIAAGRKPVTLVLSDDDVPRWMGVLNDVRLALGVALGVTDDLESDDLDPDDPRLFGVEIYSLLTWFFGELVDLQLGALPETGLE